MKSFEVSDSVLDSLKGLVAAHPFLTLVESERFVFRAPTEKDKKYIACISGGGSGHEPTHAGFVGNGLLTAAVAGDVFASPSTKQILNAIKVVSSDKNCEGVLLIAKNYTGDVLHFGLSAERANHLDINCKLAITGDDVAVGKKKGGHVGRRALAGTPLVHKITSAFAEQYGGKYGLDGCAEIVSILNESLVTIGSSLDHCKVPGRKFESELNDNQMELGMGVHNEPGVETLDPIPDAKELISKYMLPKLLDSSDKDRYFVEFDNEKDEVLLLVNNLGGLSNFVLSSLTHLTLDLLEKEYKMKPKQVLSDTLMTSFDMKGFSITLLNASGASKKIKAKFPEIDSVFGLLNAPTNAPAWPTINTNEAPSYDESLLKDEINTKAVGKFDFKAFATIMKSAAENLIKAEPHLTELDSKVGDGDCGYTLKAGAEGILKALPELEKKDLTLSQTLSQLADVIESSMGGTSGGLYSIFISGITLGVIEHGKEKEEVDREILAKALQQGLDTLYKYTQARPGSSTMIDALEPFVKTFADTKGDFSKAVKAADEGAQSTAKAEAKFGRASYVGNSSDIPDPGAIGVVEFLKGAEQAMN